MNSIKEITLKRARLILQDCSAVVWGQGFVSCPYFLSVEDGRNVFMELSHTDDEELIYEAHFPIDGNEKVTISGSSMFLKNTEGEDEQLTILVPRRLVR